MKFYFDLDAGFLIRKDVRQMLENSKRKLEFNFPGCSVLLTENKSLWDSHFYFEAKDVPDSQEANIRKWFDELKRLEN